MSAASSTSSKESTKRETTASLVHQSIRSGQYSSVRSLVEEAGSSSILWESNSVGWTALHFCASHGTPRVKWWRWILGRALENSDGQAETNQSCNKDCAIPSAPMLHLAMDDRAVLLSSSQDALSQCIRQAQALQRCCQSNSVDSGQETDDSKMPTGLPDSRNYGQDRFVSTRTSLGYSCVDLFFLRHLHPLPWQRPQVQEDATLLKEAIATVLANEVLLQRVRNGIVKMEKDERERQSKSGCDNDGSWLELGLHDVSPKDGQDDGPVFVLLEFWHRMELLLMAAHLGTLDFTRVQFEFDKKSDVSRRKWRVVHALAHTNCPTEIATLALALYPHQVMEYDEDKNLPLHIAAASPSLVVGENDNGDGNCPCILKALIEEYPHAAQFLNGQERLPLNIALASGKTWDTSVRHLLQACPEVLYGRDVPSHLHCFMLAALPRDARIEAPRATLRASRQCGGMWRFLPAVSKERFRQEAQSWLDTLQVNTIFELLKAMPDAVAGGIPS